MAEWRKNMKRLRSKVMVVLGIMLGLALLIAVYFIQPFSALKSDFEKQVRGAVERMTLAEEVFTLEDIKGLPAPVQNYFVKCGYIGRPKMAYLKASFRHVPFATGQNGPTLLIDYTQYNFVREPTRFALISSTRMGIPFQGFDCFQNGTGSMKGVIAKTFTLFDQKGAAMDQSSLVTFLSECLLVPNAALQDYISWETVDETHAAAVITWQGVQAGGVFTFNEKGEMVSFTTDDRAAVDFEGNQRTVTWTAVCADYREQNGIRQPSTLKAVWHYPEGDQTYFDGRNVAIEFD